MNEELKIKDFSLKKIIMVDDDIINLKIAAKFLEPYNVIVDKVMSGFELIEKIKHGENYDLIITDDMMPFMSGTETLAKLKDDINFAIPAVVLTANAVIGAKEKYLENGFNDYLAKPINKKELDRILNKFLL